MITLSDPDDGASQARPDIAYVWVPAILRVMASAPALFSREISGDDWIVYYLYWTGPRVSRA